MQIHGVFSNRKLQWTYVPPAACDNMKGVTTSLQTTYWARLWLWRSQVLPTRTWA